MERQSLSKTLPLGAGMPPFDLPNVNGETVSDRFFDGAPLALIVFTCNHCPYVKGSESMLFETIRAFEPKGLRTVLISSNDADLYPEDGFDKMKEKAAEASIPAPYLYDESQEIAKAFDAQCTPECYLFDGEKRLIFHGTVNNSLRDTSKVEANYVQRAIEQALAGGEPSPSFVHPVGCSIKWKVK